MPVVREHASTRDSDGPAMAMTALWMCAAMAAKPLSIRSFAMAASLDQIAPDKTRGPCDTATVAAAHGLWLPCWFAPRRGHDRDPMLPIGYLGDSRSGGGGLGACESNLHCVLLTTPLCDAMGVHRGTHGVVEPQVSKNT